MDDIINLHQLSDTILISGQPTVDQLGSLANQGVALVINLGLLGTDYALSNEEDNVLALGMDYLHIPVVFQAPTVASYLRFEAAACANCDRRILVHCALNWRWISFSAVFAERQLGWSSEASLAYRNKFWEPNLVWNEWAKAVFSL